MGLSKSTRISILLAIDSVFFLIELISGYAVHSLALVADSFHMLNDVLSLCVGLWAVKVAQQKTNSKTYTYGWQRAETLGALVNGVFLVALCVSIALEAIQRFVEPQEVSNPKLVLIVGCLGLASNLVGLVLFHDHGHSHGGHSHGAKDHSQRTADGARDAEEGHAGHAHAEQAEAAPEADPSAGSDLTAVASSSSRNISSSRRSHKKSRSRSRTYSSLDDLPVNPSSFRRAIIDASKMDQIESGESTDQGEDVVNDENEASAGASAAEQPLLQKGGSNGYGAMPKSINHKTHNHAKPKDESKGGHAHSHDLNMRGVFLHVMGDALGNIGVIVTALFIWLTDYSWRFYFDPAVSLVITLIILASAIPLCKAASRILLQAVPLGLNIDDVQEDIELLPGIVSCHHVHVWQLSDTKLVASLHVQVDFDFQGEGSARYMELARAIRDCLHEYGIHSSTIQPEFCLDPQHDHSAPADDFSVDTQASNSRPKTLSKHASKAGSLKSDADPCLLDCGDACGNGNSCCGPAQSTEPADDHDHDHDEAGHSH